MQETEFTSQSISLKSKVVSLILEDKTAILSFNRPQKYNAVNQELIDGINESLILLRTSNNIRCLVITGSGNGFSAGADIDDFGVLSPKEASQYILNAYLPLIHSLVSLNMPTIAAVNGTAAGFGAAIALACDFRVMSNSSALLFAFINMALGPDGGASWLLSRQVGYSKAMEIALDGTKIMGESCFKLGLANKLVRNDELLEASMAWAHRLTKKPHIAVKITKNDMLYAMNNNLEETMKLEAKNQLSAFESPDLVQAIEAFVKKK